MDSANYNWHNSGLFNVLDNFSHLHTMPVDTCSALTFKQFRTAMYIPSC